MRGLRWSPLGRPGIPMPDSLSDLSTPLPDEAHEALRVAVVGAIEDLAAQVRRINDTFLLLVSTADFAQSTLNTTIAGQAAISQMQTKVVELGALLSAVNTRAEAATTERAQLRADHDALAARVAALEALAPPPISTPTA